MIRTYFNVTILVYILLFSFSSCVTNKNLEYINDNLQVNSTSFNYIVQKEDLLVQISSTTKSDYDFQFTRNI